MKFVRQSLLVSSVSFLCVSFAHAAAFQLYEIGTPVNGTAGVGQAVVNTDASIAYFNPAGMNSLQSSQVMLGTQMILSRINFSKSAGNTISGSNGGNAGVLLPGADMFYVYQYSPSLKFGVSLTSPYGGAQNYDSHWPGRYSVQQMLLYTVDLMPAVAWQAAQWLSIGGGLTVEYANLYQTTALRVDTTFDGQLTLKVNDTKPGFNAGVLLTPNDTTRVGIIFRSQIVHHLTGSANFLNVSTTPSASTKLVMPANVIASISQQINGSFSVLGELGWAHWSTMVNSLVHIAGYSAVSPQNWHDTFRIGLGGQYMWTPAFMLQGGVSFDSSPTNTSRRLPNLPMDNQWRAGLGLIYEVLQGAKLGLSYEYMNLGSAKMNNTSADGTLKGSYSNNFANAIQASLNVAC